MEADEVRNRLQEVVPSGSWLQISSVEKLLNLDIWSLSNFLKANKSEERGSTRHQTKLSPVLQRLRLDGIFFEPGYVAVGIKGSDPPPWSGPRYSSIDEPRLLAVDQRPTSRKAPQKDAHVSPQGATVRASSCTPSGVASERPVPHLPVERQGGGGSNSLPELDIGGSSAVPDRECEAPDRLSVAGSDDECVADVRDSGFGDDTASATAAVGRDNPRGVRRSGDDRAWSEKVATDPVFQKLISTSTFNHFLRPVDLADLIDEDEGDVRRLLGTGAGRRATDAYHFFLRCFGITSRPFSGKMAWCLLGIGSVHMSMRCSDDVAHILSTDSKGFLFGTSMRLMSEEYDHLPEGVGLIQYTEECLELSSDITVGLSCRRCLRAAPVGKWWFVRLESIATPLLRPNAMANIGLAFRCVCSAVHIGEPLPLRRTRGTAWSVEDAVLEGCGGACPVREHGPAQTGRRRGRERMAEVVGRNRALSTPGAQAARAAPPTSSTPSTTERGPPVEMGGSSGAPSSAGALTGGTETSILNELAALRRQSPSTCPSSNGPSPYAQRGVHTTVQGLLNMCTAVHKKSNGCSGRLFQTGSCSGRSDHFIFSAECDVCGAIFGRVTTERPDPRALALGVLLAGGNMVQFESCLEMSDVQSYSSRTLSEAQRAVLVSVDRVFSREFKMLRDEIKTEPGRRRIKVEKGKHYFAQNWERLLEKAKGLEALGVQEGAISNATFTDIAACLMVAANKRREPPGFEVDGEDVWVYPVEISLDGSYRNRNHSAHGVNVVASVKRLEKDHRGLRDVVIDQVTFGRHIGREAPLQPICALSRDGGFCHVHGEENDWVKRARPGPDASDAEKEAAQRLRNGNCYSSTCLRSPLSAPATEPLGVQVLCLRLLLHGFWVTAFAHDQDAGVGHLVRALFGDALECLDRSHIQKNLKKIIAKLASGNAARVNRLFAWVVPQARERASSNADGSISRAEAFTELFSHVTMHLQGFHAFCTRGCDGSEDAVVEDERRPEVVEQPDIYDTDELRDGDGGGGTVDGGGESGGERGVATREPGDRERGGVWRGAASGGEQGRETDTAGRPTGTSSGGITPADAAQKGGNKSRKPTLKLCVGSNFTAASVRKTLGETVALGLEKGKTWSRVLAAIDKFRREPERPDALSDRGSWLLQKLQDAVAASGAACNHVVESAQATRATLEDECRFAYKHLTAKEKKETVVQLAKIDGPWRAAPSEEEGWTTTDGPARLCSATTVQPLKEAYIEACKEVSSAEEAFREESGTALHVEIVGSSQVERSSVRHQAWAESRQWSWFSHCCNVLGGNVRAAQPCSACDTHVAIVTTCVRASAFMNDLGTNYLESVNCTIAAKATKRCDFQTSHWGRAQIAIMNRALPCGALGVANRIRADLNLNELTDEAARKARALERKNLRAKIGQDHMSEEEKKRLTNERYKKKETSSARIAEYKSKHEASVASNAIDPISLGTHGVAAVRAQLESVDNEESGGEGGVEHGPKPGEGGVRKGNVKKRKRKSKAGKKSTLPEYTAAGSNMDQSAELAMQVRMGGAKEGGVCVSCINANVGREFLVARNHARHGKKICPKVRQEWEKHVARVRGETAQGRA